MSVVQRGTSASNHLLWVEVQCAKPWPVLDPFERVRFPRRVHFGYGQVTNVFEHAWRFQAAAGESALLLDDFSEQPMRGTEFQDMEASDYHAELTNLLVFIRGKGAVRPYWIFSAAPKPTRPRIHEPLDCWFNHAYAAARLGLTNEAIVLVEEIFRNLQPGLPVFVLDELIDNYIRILDQLAGGAARSAVVGELEDLLGIYGPLMPPGHAPPVSAGMRFPPHDRSPWLPSRELVQDYLTQLRQQAAEFTHWLATTVENPERLPAAARADYYLTRFPDLTKRGEPAPHSMNPTDRRALFDELDTKLVRLGRPVIPRLLERLSDRRLTRRVWPSNEAPHMSSQFEMLPRLVLRVQDVALQCLEQIVDARFYTPPREWPGRQSGLFSEEPLERREAVIAEVRKWWMANESRSPLEGKVAQLGVLPIPERTRELAKLEQQGLARSTALALLQTWATNTWGDDLVTLAEALAERADVSLRPRIRELFQSGEHSAVRYLGRYGTAEDVRCLRHRVRRELVEHDRPFDKYQFAREVDQLLNGSDSGGPQTNLLLAPLLVDWLQLRTLDVQRYDLPNDPTMSRADGAMEQLIRLTGHNAGYYTQARPEHRFAAIDLWQAWWRQEGCAAFLSRHPETQAAWEESPETLEPLTESKLPSLVRVETAVIGADVFYEMPGAEAVALARREALAALRADELVRFRFVSPAAEQAWFAQAKPMSPTVTEAAAALQPIANRAAEGPAMDAQGRFWLWSRQGPSDLAIVKRTVTNALPKREALLEGVRWMACDRQGMVWLLLNDREAPEILHGYDLATGRWHERRAQAPTSGGMQFANENAFVECFHESAAGPSFFADQFGVHVYQDGQWSYQPIDPTPTNRSHRSVGRVQFAEDQDGVVYVWSPASLSGEWSTQGWWTYARGVWRNVTAVPQVASVVPRSGSEVWLVTTNGRLAVFQDGQVFYDKDAQQRALPQWQFASAQVIGTDRAGAVWLLLRQAIEVATPRRSDTWVVAVPRQGVVRSLGTELGDSLQDYRTRGRVSWTTNALWLSRDGHLEQWSLGGQCRQRRLAPGGLRAVELNGTDLQGRLYLAGHSKCWRFNPDHAQAQATAVPVLPAMHLQVAEGVWLDSLGRAWMTWQHPRPGHVARFDGNSWHFFENESQRRSTFRFKSGWPGANGAMLFRDSDNAFHLFDKDGWAKAEQWSALVTNYTSRLHRAQPALGAEFRSHSPPPPGVRDSAGNLWWTEDSRQIWVLSAGGVASVLLAHLKLPEQWSPDIMVTVGTQSRVVAIDNQLGAHVLKLANGRISRVSDKAVVGIEWPPFQKGGAGVVDRQRRVWLPTKTNSIAVAEAGGVVARFPGQPLFADSQGGVWFWQDRDGREQLARLDADGTVSACPLPTKPDRLCEAPDATIWVAGWESLTRLACDKKRVTIVEEYPVRPRSWDYLACDRQGRLWGTTDSDESVCYATVLRR